MKNVYELVKEYGEELDEFKSALSRDWETIVFKAIDILHDIELKGSAPVRELISILNPIILEGQYNDAAINTVIQKVRELSLEADKMLLGKLNEIQRLLFAVKISLGGRISEQN